jgi:hypothetical protein
MGCFWYITVKPQYKGDSKYMMMMMMMMMIIITIIIIMPKDLTTKQTATNRTKM